MNENAPHRERREREPTGVQPRIWIASLTDYVNGSLHGAWVDADQEPEELEAAARQVLSSSAEPGAEEWAIHDYDGFGPLDLGEYPSLEDVSRIAQGIARHGPAFAAWAEIVIDASGNGSLDQDLLDQFDTHYVGLYASAEDWAEGMLDDLGVTAGLDELSHALQPYLTIDYAAFARDTEAAGDVTLRPAESGGVWVFLGL